eukprot:CAMPEP_0170567066 /NCGR_PEP_ID=MMETSP0211-20121228/80248_1 /TAXON_ID=311385 /ORGANISM="Pseudokeronopsis sp., Strain OXSARD2" /LENGTH=96 /DNA_ID=CAMNT_0010888427 /DNA_START=593 /DNA_END=883 /DNA_ORIENTATION=+
MKEIKEQVRDIEKENGKWEKWDFLVVKVILEFHQFYFESRQKLGLNKLIRKALTLQLLMIKKMSEDTFKDMIIIHKQLSSDKILKSEEQENISRAE